MTKGGLNMPTIIPVSELRNYGSVLEKVKEGEPIYLTKNGRGEYSIRKIEDEEKFQETLAAILLLSEIVKGIRTAEESGYVTSEDALAHFKARGINIG
jgi:prevent-host-death family protein